MIHGRYRKALGMLSDNAYHHHDAQQRQPAGFHTAPLVEVTFGIKILKLILILILKSLYTPLRILLSGCSPLSAVPQTSFPVDWRLFLASCSVY